MDDQFYISQEQARQLLEAIKSIDISTLTERQREAITHLASDLSPKEVAARMGVTHRTVASHISGAKFRSDARTTLGLAVALAIAIINTSREAIETPEVTEP